MLHVYTIGTRYYTDQIHVLHNVHIRDHRLHSQLHVRHVYTTVKCDYTYELNVLDTYMSEIIDYSNDMHIHFE